MNSEFFFMWLSVQYEKSPYILNVVLHNSQGFFMLGRWLCSLHPCIMYDWWSFKDDFMSFEFMLHASLVMLAEWSSTLFHASCIIGDAFKDVNYVGSESVYVVMILIGRFNGIFLCKQKFMNWITFLVMKIIYLPLDILFTM